MGYGCNSSKVNFMSSTVVSVLNVVLVCKVKVERLLSLKTTSNNTPASPSQTHLTFLGHLESFKTVSTFKLKS